MASPQINWDQPAQQIHWDDTPAQQASTYDRLTSSYDPGAAEFDQRHPILGKGVRAMSSLGGTVLGLPGSVYHAFTDDPTPQEEQEFQSHTRIPGELAVERLTGAPLVRGAQAYADPQTRPTLKQAMSVLPEALGTGAGTYVGSDLALRGAGAVKDGMPSVGPDLKAKVGALAKTGTQEAISRVPVAGRLVRRPSLGDYVTAARAKAPTPTQPELPDLSGRLADVMRDDAQRGREIQAHGLGELPRTGARPASQTGEALGSLPSTPELPEPEGLSEVQEAQPQAHAHLQRAIQPPETQAASQRLSDQIKSGSDVTPQLRKSGSPFDATDSKAWQRYPQAGSKQDLDETRSLQEQVRDAAAREQYGRVARANEEGYARNTRPRTPKSQLSQQFQSGKSGGRLADKVRQGQGSSSGEDLTDILKTSLNQARAKKLGGNNPPTGESQ